MLPSIDGISESINIFLLLGVFPLEAREKNDYIYLWNTLIQTLDMGTIEVLETQITPVNF